MELTNEKIISYVENLITGVIAVEMIEGDASLNCIYCNYGLSRMLGYSEDEIGKYIKNLRYLILPDDLPLFDQGLKDTFKADGAVDIEIRTLNGDGNLRWLYIRSNLFSKVKDRYVIVATVTDVTERKTAEEELKAQAARMHIIESKNNDGIFDYNVKTDVLTLKYFDDNGLEKEIIVSDYVTKFDPSNVYPKDVEMYLGVFEQLMTSPKYESFEIKSRLLDGNYTSYKLNLSSIVGLEGYVTRIVGRFINLDKLAASMESALENNDASSDISPRDMIFNQLVNEPLMSKGWEKSMNYMIDKFQLTACAFFPPIRCQQRDIDFKIYGDLSHINSFADESSLKRALAEFQDLSRTVDKYTIIKANDADIHSLSFQTFMMDNGLETIAYYPMFKEDDYYGCIVLINPLIDKEELHFEEEEEIKKSILQTLNAIDTCLVQNDSFGLAPVNLFARLQTLDNMDQYIYIIDYDTKQLLFVNKRVLDVDVNCRLGKCGYVSILDDRVDVEKAEAYFKNLDVSDSHSSVTSEIFNYGIRLWVKATLSWFNLSDNHRICMMSGTDISNYFIG